MVSGRQDIWAGLARTLGYESREDTSLPGRSGHQHEFAHLAVNQEARRILAVSNELDPRMASLIHADVSAAFDDYHVLTARPVTFDLQRMAAVAGTVLGSLSFDAAPLLASVQAQQAQGAPPRQEGQSPLEYLESSLGPYAPIAMPFFRAASLSGLGPAQQLILLIREASLLDWPAMFPKEGDPNPQISIEPLTRVDSQSWDRAYGLCPFPLYELSESDWELFRSARDLDAINDRLLSLGVRQYFHPPVDQAALGIIDRGITAPQDVANAVTQLPAIGHPTERPEMLDPSVKGGIELLDALRDRGLIDEAEIGLVVTAKGSELRALVRKRPREAAISKLINRVKITLSTENWFNNITLKSGE